MEKKSNDRWNRTAETLLNARRTLTPILNLPEDQRPATLEEAYAVQDRMVATLGSIGGWKVGSPKPVGTPLFGPMPLAQGFFTSGSRVPTVGRRLRGIEAEIAFQIGYDMPLRDAPYSREEVMVSVASVHPAIELLESAYVNPFATDTVDRMSMIADLQANGGFAYGDARADWSHCDLLHEKVAVRIDGGTRFEGMASNPAGTNLVGLVTWLANEGSHRTGGLKAGQWITTGSWSGWTPARSGSNVEIQFSTFGAVRLTFD